MSGLETRIKGLKGDALTAELDRATSEEIHDSLFPDGEAGLPATKGELEAVFDGVCGAVKEALRSRDERIKALEAIVAEHTGDETRAVTADHLADVARSRLSKRSRR